MNSYVAEMDYETFIRRAFNCDYDTFASHNTLRKDHKEHNCQK